MKGSHFVAAALALVVACKGKDKHNAEPSPEPAKTPEKDLPRPSQQPLPQMPALVLDDDAKRAEKVALGHVLFFDKRLSGKSDRTCYSCHKNEDGTGGHDPLAIGSGDVTLTRHSSGIWNVGWWKNAFYWEGRAATLEAAIKEAWGGPIMNAGTENLDKNAAALAKLPAYKKLFADAFGATEIKADHVAQAIAEYMRTLVCNDTAYDKFAAGDKTALSDAQQKGLDIFLGKGGCITCHSPPFFSTSMGVDGGIYFNVGIGTKDVPEDKVDSGRMKVTNAAADWASFKPPSLRNVTKSPPYFHDGSVAKLEDAVKLMSSGAIKNKNINPALTDRALSNEDRANLIAFLSGLDCPGKLEEPKVP